MILFNDSYFGVAHRPAESDQQGEVSETIAALLAEMPLNTLAKYVEHLVSEVMAAERWGSPSLVHTSQTPFQGRKQFLGSESSHVSSCLNLDNHSMVAIACYSSPLPVVR